jgi:hypothetical protein
VAHYEGDVHAVRREVRSTEAAETYAVRFAPYSSDATFKEVLLKGRQALLTFFIDGLGLTDEVLKVTLSDLDSKGDASVRNVVMSDEALRGLGLSA